MYKSADIVVEYLNRIITDKFSAFKSVISLDEINVLNSVKNVYLGILKLIKDLFYELAVEAYETIATGDFSLVSDITQEWLDENIFKNHSPVTLYVFDNEMERRYLRLSEAIIASGCNEEVISKACKQVAAMVAQYAILTVDAASIQAYKDTGVKSVIWISLDDGKRCKECKRRHGKVYDVDNIPPKPHPYCRCLITPYDKGEK